MAKNNVSGYLRQREKGRSDRAYCRVDGKKIKLGIYGSAESKRKYADLLAAGDDQDQQSPAGDLQHITTVVEVLASYLEYAEGYYGLKSPEWYHLCNLMQELRKIYTLLPAAEFTANKLRSFRDRMIEKGWSRRYVNDQVARTKRMMKWAAGREMVPPTTCHSLCMVEGLRRGKTPARETDPIEPVDGATVERTLPYLPELVATAVQVQRLCGCRPGELIRIRKKDIDRSGEVWVCRLKEHKTAHRGKSREIYFGPKAQELLLPRLICGDDDRLFPFRRDSYRRAIHRACKRAGIPNWCPLQIRHAAGTHAREVGGLESAQLLLGHSRCDVTQVYAETNRERALELAKRIG